jgi:hypothetical protein
MTTAAPGPGRIPRQRPVVPAGIAPQVAHELGDPTRPPPTPGRSWSPTNQGR